MKQLYDWILKHRVDLEYAAMAVFGILVGLLLCVLLAGCVATQGYTEDRLKQADEVSQKRETKIAQVTEESLTGERDPDNYKEAVQAVLQNEPLPPPSPEQMNMPWTEITTGAVSVILAYLGVNMSRDNRRRKLNEATNKEEAEKLGYYEDIASKARSSKEA